MICTKCNNQVPEGCAFCPYCGQKVSAQPERPVQNSLAQKPAAPQAAPVAPQAPTAAPQAPTAAPQSPSVQPQAPAAPQQPAQSTMKRCPVCATVVPADAKFCKGCGATFRMPQTASAAPQTAPAAPQTAPAAPQTPTAAPQTAPAAPQTAPAAPQTPTAAPQAAAPAAPQAPTAATQAAPTSPQAKCSNCGNALHPGARFCNVCGKPQQAAPAPAAYTPAPPKTAPAKSLKINKKTAILLGCVAAVVLIIILGVVTSWFGADRPLTEVYNAAMNTVEAGSFQATFTLDANGMEVEGEAEVMLDYDEEALYALVEVSSDYMDATIVLADGYAMIDSDGYAYVEDISYVQDMVFEMLEEDQSFDEILENAVELVFEMGGVEDFLDEDETLKSVKKINTSFWMTRNAGYKVKYEGLTKKLVLQPKLGDMVVGALKTMKPAFEDEDDYEDLMDEIDEDEVEDINDDVEAEVAFGIKMGKLVSVEVALDGNGAEITGEITFEDIGKLELDVDDLEDMLDEAR